MNLRYLLSHDFRHTAFNQLWRLVSGPLLLFFIPLYLSAEAQGYWYTFISLAALAIFADMGFSAILMLFSSHEFAHLKFSADYRLVGDEKYIKRMATLWVFSLKWSVAMACVVFPIVLVIGFVILSEKDLTVEWEWPWIIYGLSSINIFINSMALSFIEGCDKVGDIQKIRLKISVVNVAATLLLLLLGVSLYALAFSLLASAVVGCAIIVGKYRQLFLQLFSEARGVKQRWFKEIMPLIWRYAVSWVSGFFILSIFTPVAFHYYSPVEAGKVGLSIALCTAIFAIANVWIIIITPKINMFVARKDSYSLNVTFYRHLFLAALTYAVGMLTLYLVLRYMHELVPITDRLVGAQSFMCLALGWFFQLIVNALAVYVRAHKEEPLMFASFLNGIYVAGTTIMIAIYLPFEYFFGGFLSAYSWVLPWVICVFVKYRNNKGLHAA